MSAATWLIIAIIGFSLAGIALVAAVFMFIKMNIPAIIGDLTGKTVAREIKAMRESNFASGDKRFRPSAVNRERGPLTDKVMPNAEAQKMAHASKRLDKTDGLTGGTRASRRLSKEQTYSATVNPAVQVTAGMISEETEVLTDLNATEVLTDSNATEVLSDPNATEVLTDQNATEVLTDSDATEVLSDPNATEVLSEEPPVNATTVLSNTDELEEKEILPVAFKVTYSEVLIHSDEVI
ncbi:MAG: hypothetical protein E7550_02925 [Ruminococcaceae bacterium]|nr:hypothetical protein [Oscillospiraceae bacterium]